MRVVKTIGDEQVLFRKLDSSMRSLIKRNVTYIIYPHTSMVADINIMVTGKRGTGQVSMAIIYDEFELAWCVHCQGKKYILESLSEINFVAKRLITHLSTSMTKM